MKKYLIALLLSLSCVCTLAAVGCNEDSTDTGSLDSASDSTNDSSSSSSVSNEEYALSFIDGAGFDFESVKIDGVTQTSLGALKAKSGSVVSFRLDIGAFYAGYPIVLVNGGSVSADDTQTLSYSFTVSGETTVKVNGIEKDESNMTGSGAFDDAFVISRPIDLVYIAEQVNNGVPAYVNGAYVLANDIDCKGEALQVIGNGATDNAYFSGCITSYDDPNTEEIDRFTISNFTIDSTSSNAVGLFGAVYASPNVTSSGLINGIRLENFTINASLKNATQSENLSMFCGSLVGYGVGARLLACEAVNGVLNVTADENYFSYAGGLVGYMQAVYDASASYGAEIGYATVDVDLSVEDGLVLYSGGIVGALETNYALTPAFVHNCVASGDVDGGFNAGGIVGFLGRHTSIANCYAKGEITAENTFTDEEVDSGYLYAYAGGLVGYASNDTIVNDSMSACESVDAVAYGGGDYAIENDFVGGGDEAGVSALTAKKFVVFNCILLEDYDLQNATALQSALGWTDADWIFANGIYPVVNYNASTTPFKTTLTLQYTTKDAGVTIELDGETGYTQNYFDSAEDTYAPIADVFAVNGLSQYLKADNGYISYGYFLDEACTLPVPYSYLATKNIVFYVGFADATPILGKYSLALDYTAEEAFLEFTVDEHGGLLTYTDGATTETAYFVYDGETITVHSARLARYFYNDDKFDLNAYQVFDFFAVVNDGVIKLYDGVYFTKDAPLRAYETLLRGEYYLATGETLCFYGKKGEKTVDGNARSFSYTVEDGVITLTYADTSTETVALSALLSYDAFKGAWVKAVTVGKTYRFDGMGGWSYTVGYGDNAVTKTGVYERLGDTEIKFTDDGVEYKASFSSEGFLTLVGNGKTQTYYNSDASVGTWISSNEREITLTLHGLNQRGVGTATLVFDAGYAYTLTYAESEASAVYALYLDGAIFGAYTFVAESHKLSAIFYYPVLGDFIDASMYLVDDYDGVWISNESSMNTLQFSGLGLYGNTTLIVTDITNGTETEVEIAYELENFTLVGLFVYNGVTYTLTYDEDLGTATVFQNGNEVQLHRKDRFADIEFVTNDGKYSYSFDGKSALNMGGTFTENDEQYAYKMISETEYAVYENAYAESATPIGTITLSQDGKYYQFTTDTETKKLYIKNPLMGTWALGGQFALMEIGASDLLGNINAVFGITEDSDGYEVSMSIVDASTLHFKYYIGTQPVEYYLFLLDDSSTMLLSESGNLSAGDWAVCSKKDAMFGSWKNESAKETIVFDGVQSSFAYGVAKVIWQLLPTSKPTVTYYYYTVRGESILIWTQEQQAGKTLYFKLETAEITDKGAYINGDKAFIKTQVDALYLTVATDENGTEYTFDGTGGVVATNGEASTVYAYTVTSYNDDDTVTLVLTDTDGNEYTATLDYGDEDSVTIVLSESET
ncbi:MAG: hypothetical protein IJB34_06360 [Clostridia bacterium]|nr:hypothetical protein [Clostridia bacterium]